MRPSRNVASARTPSSEVPGRSTATCPLVPKPESSEPDVRRRSSTSLPAALPPASTLCPAVTFTAPPTASASVAFRVTVPRCPKARSGSSPLARATAGASASRRASRAVQRSIGLLQPARARFGAPSALKFFPSVPFSRATMRLFFATALAFLAIASTASAATPGLNTGMPLSEAGWAKLAESHAKTVRVWAYMPELESSPGVLSAKVNEYRGFADRARTLGVGTVITLMGAYDATSTPPDPAAYARVAQELAGALKGHGVFAYEGWNEPDDAPHWAPRPSPAAYTPPLKAAYPAFKAGDASAAVATGGLVGNDYDFLQALYDNGGKGYFDAVGVHTDTACLTTDPREYYREPNGRIGRYSFTGYREVHWTMQ